MKPEEEFVKNSIREYLVNTGVKPSFLAGTEPPDYFVKIGNATYPLEVTNAETIAYSNDGQQIKFRHFTEPLFDFFDQINKDAVLKFSGIPANEQILIFLRLPILNWNKFTRTFKELLGKGYLAFTTELKRQFPEDVISISIIHKQNVEHPITFGLSARKTIININEQVKELLREIVCIKEQKLDKAAISGERWLGILNNYFFDDTDIWKNEIEKLAYPHSFKRIFIVNSFGKVLDVEFN